MVSKSHWPELRADVQPRLVGTKWKSRSEGTGKGESITQPANNLTQHSSIHCIKATERWRNREVGARDEQLRLGLGARRTRPVCGDNL